MLTYTYALYFYIYRSIFRLNFNTTTTTTTFLLLQNHFARGVLISEM